MCGVNIPLKIVPLSRYDLLPCGVTAAESTELVLVNFYADWCRFSNMLEPIWDGGADLVAKKLDTRRVLMAKIDCDKEGGCTAPL